jgi:FkbM family methyltransferase
MLVTPPEPLSKQLQLYGFFEEGLTRFMLDRLAPGMTVIDVGAHYGYFTLLAAHLVCGAGSVHAFEPTPSTYRLLERNTAGRPNVRTNPHAVWSQESELELQDFGTQWSMFNSVFAPRGERVTGVIEKVAAVPLDAYVDRLELAPDFIKIDAESAEAHVIAGLATTLTRDRPALTVEVGDMSPDQPLSSRELLCMICETYGYEAFEFSGGAIQPHRLKERYVYDNVLLDHPKRRRDPPSRH